MKRGSARFFSLLLYCTCTAVLFAFFLPSEAAEAAADGDAFTIDCDEYGRVYRINMEKVKSAADLAAVPGIRTAWNLHGRPPFEWLDNARDVDGDGGIDLIVSAEAGKGRCIVRYEEDGSLVWKSAPVNRPVGNESGMAIEDLDGDGSCEVIFNVYRQLWCLDADTGKAEWTIDLPACRNNFQASVVGRFLDGPALSVACRVNEVVTCYTASGKKAWTYRIKNKDLYGHEMAQHAADGDGRDEVYVSLNGLFLALDGGGTLRWSDTACRNHGDFILCGDVDGDGDREIVYDRDGCAAQQGPVVCVDGRTGALVRQWDYARPGIDHLQRATLGDFCSSNPGVELAGVGKRKGSGGIMMWSKAGKPAWREDTAAGWLTCGQWDGEGSIEIMVSGGVGGGDSWEVWTGEGRRVYAFTGMGATPLGIECAGPERPDLDGNGRSDVLLWTRRGYVVLMEGIPEQ